MSGLADMADGAVQNVTMRLKHALADALVRTRPDGGDAMFGPAAIEQLARDGYLEVPDFLPKALCDNLIAQSARLATDHPEFVVRESNGADTRIYGADRLADMFALQPATAPLDAMACSFYRSASVQSFVMAGHVVATPDNLGSGSGWHRDSPFSPQIKFMVYLSDVAAGQGPFEYIPQTHQRQTITEIGQFLGSPLSQYRFGDDEIDRLETAGIVPRRKTFTGAAGALIVFNAKGIHRGKPLVDGERWAITRYYYRRMPPGMPPLPPLAAG